MTHGHHDTVSPGIQSALQQPGLICRDPDDGRHLFLRDQIVELVRQLPRHVKSFFNPRLGLASLFVQAKTHNEEI